MFANQKFIASLIVAVCLAVVVAPAIAEGPRSENLEGWSVDVDAVLLDDDHKQIYEDAKKALANHLQRIKYILPAERVAQLQTIRIRLDNDYKPFSGMQYHPSESWLIKNGHDPAFAKHIHISQASTLTDRRQWAKHPYVILHELAHGYHDQVLGFDDEEIIATFEQAKKTGIYETVLDHQHREVKHYSLTNHKEYFAESTESYLGVNDFYPFVRAELKLHDPRMYSLMQKIWGNIP